MVLNPKNVFTYTNRSYGYLLMGRYDEALADANKAIEVDPNESNAYFLKGRILVALNKNKDAIKYLDKAIEYNPKVARFYYFRGKAFLETNETERGLEDMKKAAALGHKGARGYLNSKGVQ
jgi:tetratricopeptide (TPR) repeat protein